MIFKTTACIISSELSNYTEAYCVIN